jgi:hypothetical protein
MEIETLKKFSKINDKLYIEPDRITVINGGRIGAVDVPTSKLAGVELKNKHSFERKIGINSVTEFLKIIDMMSDNVEIQLFDKYIRVVDVNKKIKVEMNLTDSFKNIIPEIDILTKLQNSLKKEPCTRFVLDWNTIESIFKAQVAIYSASKKSYLFFHSEDDKTINLKIGSTFSKSIETSASFEFKTNIKSNDLEVLRDGYVRIDMSKDILVKDTYEITILDKAVVFKSMTDNIIYLILSSMEI